MGGQPQLYSESTKTAHLDVSIWLFTLCVCVLLTVWLGGLTRLTDSGLSITEWQPIAGILPPLSAQDWHMAFEKYKAIPEYELVNRDFTLGAFKTIYWWEWAHRQLGRFVGLVFLLPFIWLSYRKRIPENLYGWLFCLFGLGCLQGFMGWYMVQSGLHEGVDVSQYRLAVHLGLALIIFCLAYWIALRCWRGVYLAPQAGGDVVFGGFLTGIIFVQSLMGALVAGLDAGKIYTDWPFMNGYFIPPDAFKMTPLIINFFENYATVQFNHRMGAYFLLLIVFIHAYQQYKNKASTYKTALWLALGVLGQAILGVTALVYAVPLFWGMVHQIGAMLVLVLTITHLHRLRYPDIM